MGELKRRRPSGRAHLESRLAELPEEERLVVEAAAVATGEHRIRWVDSRVFLIFLFVVLGGAWLINSVTTRLDTFQLRSDRNCVTLDRGLILQFDGFLDNQIALIKKRTDLAPKVRQATIANYQKAKVARLSCGRGGETARDTRYPYQPFKGSHDLADGVRLALILASGYLLAIIILATVAGRRRGRMSLYQLARFVGVAGLATSTSLGSATRFGGPLNGYVIANLIFVLIEWYGVWGLRRKQHSPMEGR